MFIGLAVFVGLRLLVNQATAQPVDTLAVLDVPYVAQSEALCGGAAAAMVMRYWGAQGINAEDFAPYVSSDAGIRTGDLVVALDSLGWQTYPFRGTAADVQGHLKRGRPVVALLEVAPQRYHYVVVIAWGESGVLYHDPAAAPSRVLPLAQWEEQWQATGYWTLLLLPPAEETTPADTTTTTPAAMGADEDQPCARQVAQAIAQAYSGQLDDAMTQLAAAQTQCPKEAAAFREAAAIRFKQARWMEAERLAEQALARDSEDAYTWRLLAATRFLSEDRTGALHAWNQLGEPQIDLIQIEGLDRTRYT
ncbi:MAG TPA: C39 family peptidase, partial [Rhodothermales bacterium]|nr:C39 family peptidase [Rhodothermales bacterium]